MSLKFILMFYIMANNAKLKELYKEYNLTPDDIFKSPQQWVIITRTGIDKIQAKAKIQIDPTLVVSDTQTRDFIVRAVATMGDQTFITFGESSPSNTKNKYPVAMAEKRARSRAVLQLTGFYSEGVFGEDEADDFSKVAKSDRKSISELIHDTL